ncbi:MAG TPA: hypothetical protein VFQ45_06365 [Longimicrobium sp.]|nr:hypothetical protein [Longimicrobium sp.]
MPAPRIARLLALASALAGCTPPAVAPAPVAAAEDPYEECYAEEVRDPCFARIEQRLLAGTGGRVVRDGLELTFHPRQGAPVTLYDDTTDADVLVRQRYLTWLPGIGYHLLRIQYYEGGAYFLVSDRTGAHENIPGPPLVSPDGRRVVSASMDLEAAYDPNRIEIWRVTPERLEKEWEASGDACDESTPWGPSDVRWVDARTLEWVKNEHQQPDYRRTRMLLRHENGGWTLREMGPAPNVPEP